MMSFSGGQNVGSSSVCLESPAILMLSSERKSFSPEPTRAHRTCNTRIPAPSLSRKQSLMSTYTEVPREEKGQLRVQKRRVLTPMNVRMTCMSLELTLSQACWRIGIEDVGITVRADQNNTSDFQPARMICTRIGGLVV